MQGKLFLLLERHRMETVHLWQKIHETTWFRDSHTHTYTPVCFTSAVRRMFSEERPLWVIPFSSRKERPNRICRASLARDEVEENWEDLTWFSSESLYHSDTITTLSVIKWTKQDRSMLYVGHWYEGWWFTILCHMGSCKSCIQPQWTQE